MCIVHCAMHDNYGHGNGYEFCLQPKRVQIYLLFKDSKKKHHGHWSYIGLLFYLRKVFQIKKW